MLIVNQLIRNQSQIRTKSPECLDFRNTTSRSQYRSNNRSSNNKKRIVSGQYQISNKRLFNMDPLLLVKTFRTVRRETGERFIKEWIDQSKFSNTFSAEL